MLKFLIAFEDFFLQIILTNVYESNNCRFPIRGNPVNNYNNQEVRKCARESVFQEIENLN